MQNDARLKAFMYHGVDVQTACEMAQIRLQYYTLARDVLALVPQTGSPVAHRVRELALVALEESCMRAIQCLALASGTPVDPGVVELGPRYA